MSFIPSILALGLVMVPHMSQAQVSPDRLAQFYHLLFAQGCTKHPGHIPGRNAHWLNQAGFHEPEFPKLIEQLRDERWIRPQDGFIIGTMGECG